MFDGVALMGHVFHPTEILEVSPHPSAIHVFDHGRIFLERRMIGIIDRSVPVVVDRDG